MVSIGPAWVGAARDQRHSEASVSYNFDAKLVGAKDLRSSPSSGKNDLSPKHARDKADHHVRSHRFVEHFKDVKWRMKHYQMYGSPAPKPPTGLNANLDLFLSFF